MPGRGKPPHLQSVSDLWSVIIGFSIFGGLFLGVTLACTWANRSASFWPAFLVGGFVVVWAIVPSVVCARELVRRGVWVPPGMARHPILMAVALSVLLMALGVAVDVAAIGLGPLIVWEGSPALTGASFGGLGFAVIGFVYLVRRLVRKPPAAKGSAATEQSPPAGRSPE